MDMVLGMISTFLFLIFSVYKGIYVGIPLFAGFFIFAFISWKRGFSPRNILRMSYSGGKKTFLVLQIFVLIGAITSIWMASGTVPAIVYYGIKFMNPNFFILYAFLISALVSFLLGTSLGTVSTVGIALIVMARGGNVDLNATTGAIMSGAYFGDRCSPMSSSANLVANLTKTNLFINIKNMFRTSIIPFTLTVILYTYFSSKHHLNIISTSIDTDIIRVFNINLIVLLPALIIIVFSLLKINVKTSMLVSIIASSIIGVFLQKYSLFEILKHLFLGFELDKTNPLYTIIKGGGVFSMWKASLVIYISCALSGIFEGTDMLKSIENMFLRAKTHAELFSYTSIVSLLTAALGCSQAISVVLTSQLMSNAYKEKNIDKYDLALDLENTGIVLSALIPWNMAAFVPTTTMNVSKVGFIPYAFYLYLIPIISFISLKINERKSTEESILS